MIEDFLATQTYLHTPVFIMKYLTSKDEKYYVIFTEDYIIFYSMNILPQKSKVFIISNILSTNIHDHYRYLEKHYDSNKFQIVKNDVGFFLDVK